MINLAEIWLEFLLSCSVTNQFISVILTLLPNNCHAKYICLFSFVPHILSTLLFCDNKTQIHRQQNNLTLRNKWFLILFFVQSMLVVVLYIVGGQMSPVTQIIYTAQSCNNITWMQSQLSLNQSWSWYPLYRLLITKC